MSRPSPFSGLSAVMRRALFIVFAVAACGDATAGDHTPTDSGSVSLTTEDVATGFDTVWELAWGPDGKIWVTERGGQISRVDPQTGQVVRVGEVPGVLEIGEGGLMGIAFHPDFATQPWVYVTHTYSGVGTRNRVVRMLYDGTALGPPQVLVNNIPGASIHDGSRIVIGPDRFLYVTTGDASNPDYAQDRTSLAGKVLRMTLDGQPAPGNPFGTLVYSFGHRNPQGITFTPDGALYLSEHGPSDNDEVNRIEAGRNYGWPGARGMCDGDAGTHEQAFCSANEVVEPLASWTPTLATSALAWYGADLIPAFRGKLLLGTLKEATLYALTLSNDGRAVGPITRLFPREFGRIRAVLVAPDGAVYLGTSNRDGRATPMPLDDRIIRIRPS